MDKNLRGWVIAGFVALALLVFVFAATLSYLSELREQIELTETQKEQLRTDLSAKTQEASRKDETIKSLEGQVSDLTTKKRELEAAQPRGDIEDVWVDHNQYRYDRKGMVIHVKLALHNARSLICELSAYFYDSADTPLKDYDNDYRTTSGQASTWETLTPASEVANYANYELFMPYDELHMTSGVHKLKFNVQLRKKSESRIFDTSDYYSFNFTQH